MKSNLQKHRASLIIWSLIWALAIISTAFLFKGNPAKIWVEGAVNAVGMLVFLLLKPQRTICVQ